VGWPNAFSGPSWPVRRPGERSGAWKSAALLVVRPGGGYGGNHDRWLDLRIDHSDSPIADLRGLLDLHTLYFGRTAEDELVPFDEDLQTEVGLILDSIGWSDPDESLENNLQSWLGGTTSRSAGWGLDASIR
jgi:uncharacterized Ntn-hydrolase superfamily protein